MLDYLRRKRFINSLVADTKLQYQEGAHSHAPNGRTVVMPEYRPDFTEDQDQRFMSELIQKCYHALPDNIGDSKQGIIADSPFGAVFNTVCRSNAQLKRQGMLPGADQYMEQDHCKRTTDFLEAIQEGVELPPMYEAVKAFDVIARSKWQTHSDFSIAEQIRPEAKAYLDKLLADPKLMEEYLTPRIGGPANVELCKRLITEMTSEETAEQMQQQGTSDGDGDEEGDSSRKKGKGEGEEDGEELSSSDEAVYKRIKEELEGFDVNEIGQDQTIKYPDEEFESEHSALKIKEVDPKPLDSSRYPDRLETVQRHMTDTLSKKVRNVLKVYSQAKFQGGKKRGKINKRAIASVVMDNDRIFRKKEVKDVLDTSVCLLVDSSGSMAGNKYTYATAATAMMNECLSKLNIPHSIYGFTTGGANNCIMYTHKDFYESKTKEDVVSSMLSNDVHLNGNDDGDAVLYAHDHLIRQKQKRKILIVLSDGQPTEGGGDPRTYLKQITGAIQDKSPVELYGLGILTTSVKDYYKNNRVIHKVTELEETLLDLIKSSIVS